MKVTISEIPLEGLEIRQEMHIDLGELRLGSPARLDLRVEKLGSEVVVKGTVSADVMLACGRCLNEFAAGVEAPIDVVYHPASDISGDEKRELRADELETGFYEGDELDMDELVREQMLLNLPIKSLCGEACKGICPHCGANLNEGPCTCPARPGDARLEALKDFFERRKS